MTVGYNPVPGLPDASLKGKYISEFQMFISAAEYDAELFGAVLTDEIVSQQYAELRKEINREYEKVSGKLTSISPEFELMTLGLGSIFKSLSTKIASKAAIKGMSREAFVVAIRNALGKGGQGFSSFTAFKRAMGEAGEGLAWHHIVEQHADNIAKFGAEQIHNTSNLIKLPHGAGSIHAKVTGHYNSLMRGTNMRVRDYVKTLSYEEQYKYGINKLIEFGWIP